MVNSFLNKITMYSLMMYYLLFLVAIASILSFFKVLLYNPLDILLNAFYLVVVCKLANFIFAKIFKVKTNPESSIISGLILSLIIGPVSPLSNPILPTAAGILAMASKYLVVWKGRHIFNPAAFGAVAVAILLNQGASWWVGSMQMASFILLGGLLILKKIKRFEMVGTFFAAMTILFVAIAILDGEPFNLFTWLQNHLSFLLVSPLAFFTLVMFTEPLTTPFKKINQIIYAILIAVLFFILGVLPYPLEASLLTGNIFAFLVNKSFRQVLTLKKKEQLSKDVIGFWFEPWKKFDFKPGQYLEWMLSHPKPDNRGVRRFFSIASSPTENLVLLASKFYEKPSTFKQALAKLEPGDEIVVSDLQGEFTMPDDTNQKLVLIAGGIGVTPFRSMAKWMIDQGESRDVVLLHSNKTKEDIVFRDIFERAEKLGFKTIYVNTDTDGYIDENVISEKVPDYKDRKFYVSGPEPMVEAFEKMLYKMGIAKKNVKRDYFEGYSETHQK
jgi:glycine betaine catabolism B